MSPKEEAAAFRIWQHAEPRGWEMTITDAAEALGLYPPYAGRIARMKGWTTRFRAGKLDCVGFSRTQMMGSFNGRYM